MQDNAFSSHLYDEKGFYKNFIEDLTEAKSEVIIESPFATEKRVNKLDKEFSLDVVRKLGEGGVAQAYLLENKVTGEKLVLKMLGKKWDTTPPVISHEGIDWSIVDFFHDPAIPRMEKIRTLLTNTGENQTSSTEFRGMVAEILIYLELADNPGLVDAVPELYFHQVSDKGPVLIQEFVDPDMFVPMDKAHNVIEQAGQNGSLLRAKIFSAIAATLAKVHQAGLTLKDVDYAKRDRINLKISQPDNKINTNIGVKIFDFNITGLASNQAEILEDLINIAKIFLVTINTTKFVEDIEKYKTIKQLQKAISAECSPLSSCESTLLAQQLLGKITSAKMLEECWSIVADFYSKLATNELNNLNRIDNFLAFLRTFPNQELSVAIANDLMALHEESTDPRIKRVIQIRRDEFKESAGNKEIFKIAELKISLYTGQFNQAQKNAEKLLEEIIYDDDPEYYKEVEFLVFLATFLKSIYFNPDDKEKTIDLAKLLLGAFEQNILPDLSKITNISQEVMQMYADSKVKKYFDALKMETRLKQFMMQENLPTPLTDAQIKRISSLEGFANLPIFIKEGNLDLLDTQTRVAVTRLRTFSETFIRRHISIVSELKSIVEQLDQYDIRSFKTDVLDEMKTVYEQLGMNIDKLSVEVALMEAEEKVKRAQLSERTTWDFLAAEERKNKTLEKLVEEQRELIAKLEQLIKETRQTI